MKMNVFAAGIMMAALALAGCGAMTNAVTPSLSVAAASVQSADDAAKQLIADQSTAEQNALSYTGAGFSVVSSELLSGKENAHTFKVGVAPAANQKDVLYLNVNGFQCCAMSEYNGMTTDQTDLFFAEKRVAECKVLAAAGKGSRIVGFQVLPGKGDAVKFRFGVSKSGKSQVTYFYADKSDCTTDGADAAVYSRDTQNLIMNFVGNYSNGRAMMTVSAKGSDKATVHVTWSSNAAEHSEWTMTGNVSTVGDCVIVDYDDCFKESFSYAADGTLVQDTMDYTGGKGTLTFHADSVIWNDSVEGIANGAVFTWCK